MLHHTTSLPDIPLTATSLDCREIQKGEPIRNCRVISCSHYCNGGDVFTKHSEAFNHGRIFHQSFYLSLPPDVLRSIDWHVCVDGCRKLILTHERFTAHQKECTFWNSKQPAQQQQPPMKPRPCDDPNYASLFNICPESRRDDLESVIEGGANTEGLYATLIGWMIAETKPAAGAHDNA